MKKFLYPFLLMLFCIIPALSHADTFSLSVPSGTEVVMSDPESTVPVNVTNNGPSKSIRQITFNIDTAKYSFSSATLPPDGWCINGISAGSITFALVQGGGSCSNGNTVNRIDPGQSRVFNITLLPIAAGSDSTDTFSSVSVISENGFTLSGALPTWTRRSLEASLSASPASVGTGDGITLLKQVVNRSTATQVGIGSSPAPPSPSLPIVTNTEGPYYATTLLTAALTVSATTVNVSSTADYLTVSATTVNVSSTADFPSGGSLMIGAEEVCYSNKTATSFTGATRGCNSTTAAAHSSGAVVYGTDPFTLLPG